MKKLANYIVFAGIVSVCCIGCVERRLTVRSNPPGALVLLDGEDIGHTPVSVPFTYYGVREITLVKDGFETRTVKQKIAAPWYQIPPIDFAAEVLWPFHIRDERDYAPFDLQPKMAVMNEELLQRAEQIRSEGQNPPPELMEKAQNRSESARKNRFAGVFGIFQK